MSVSDVFRLDGQVAIVTGAGAGIGQGISEFFAQAGAEVVVSDLDTEVAQAVTDRVHAAGARRSRWHVTSPMIRNWNI